MKNNIHRWVDSFACAGSEKIFHVLGTTHQTKWYEIQTWCNCCTFAIKLSCYYDFSLICTIWEFAIICIFIPVLWNSKDSEFHQVKLWKSLPKPTDWWNVILNAIAVENQKSPDSIWTGEVSLFRNKEQASILH